MRPTHWQTSHYAKLSLGLLTAAALVAWLVVLPRLVGVESIRTAVDRNESLGIDPSAKFYTELPLTPDVTWRMERLQQQVGPGAVNNRAAATAPPAGHAGAKLPLGG